MAAFPTAHALVCLRFAGRVAAPVARLATGSGGLTPGQAGFAPAYYGIGMACAQLGQTNRAVEALTKYLELESSGPLAEQARTELKRLNR